MEVEGGCEEVVLKFLLIPALTIIMIADQLVIQPQSQPQPRPPTSTFPGTLSQKEMKILKVMSTSLKSAENLSDQINNIRSSPEAFYQEKKIRNRQNIIQLLQT